MPTERRADLPVQVRADFARALPTTANREARTVDVTWSTGASVTRYDPWTDEAYEEQLDLDGANLAELNRGAPVLDAHHRWQVGDVLGVVERAWVEGGEGRATIRFSEREEVAPIMRDVMDGILRNLSVGYRVHKFEVTKRDGQTPIYRAVDWTPFEVSLVPVGADPAAQVRSAAPPPAAPCTFVFPENHGERQMTVAPSNGAPAAAAATESNPAAPPVDLDQVRQEAAAAERQRAQAIRERVRAVHLDGAIADQLIEEGVPLERVADRLIDELARGATPPTRPAATARQATADATRDNPVFRRQAMAQALAYRALTSQGLSAELAEPARAYAEVRSPLQMLAEFARSEGARISPHLSPSELFGELVGLRMHSVSDFPTLMGDAQRQVLMAAYQAANPTFREVFARRNFPDFRKQAFLRVGDFPELAPKTETGEYKYGTLSESGNEIAADEYGRIVALSRKLLINDNIGAFAEMGVSAARSVAQWENRKAWGLLALNSGGGPMVKEPGINGGAGRPLFHADHKNLAGAGAAPSVTTLSAARAAMRKAVGLDGQKLNLLPKILVVGPDLETAAQQLLVETTVAATDQTTNPFKRSLQIVVDAEIEGYTWYLFADPNTAPVLVYGYVNGMDGPQMATDSDFDTNGLKFRVILDWGAGAVDYRGAWKNPGAAPS